MAGSGRPGAGSVRVRTTLLAVAVVGLALVVAAVTLVLLVRRSTLSEIEIAAELRAGDIAAIIEAGAQPDELTLGVADDEDAVVQVVDARGVVVAASPNVSGHPPLADLEDGESTRLDETPVEDDPFLVVGQRAGGTGGPLMVLVGRTVEDVDEITLTITRLAAAGVPLVLLVVGFTTWRVVGRALAPVEAMRREVEAISAAELHRRVPQPATDDEIARLSGTLNRMLDRLQQSMRRQQRFVSDASHELRSPIAAIRQHAEVAQAYPDRTDLVELADVVLAENHRVQRLVEDLLILARADEDGLRVAHRPVDLDDVAFDSVATARSTGRSTADVEIDTSALSAGQVEGDANQLRRAVGNLVDNAVRHAAGKIALGVREAAGDVTLWVDDDGPGVPKADRGRIFERFVRLDEARARHTGGTGLGLAIVAQIVAAHRGQVAVTDSPLGGARFEITLPARAD